MDEVIAIEGELNAIVKEYLDFLGYSRTSSTFEGELRSLGKQLGNETTSPRNDSQKNDIQRKMVVSFESGRCTEFFRMWNEYVPDDLQENDQTCQKLHFNINIYFAIYPITHGNQDRQELERSMRVFKGYLETKGSALSQTTEFLPYYALPYIPDPTSHPSFKPLFVSSWSFDLKNNVQDFLASTLKSQEKPKLYTLYRENVTEIERERKLYSEQLKKLQTQLTRREQRSSQYQKRYSKIQADYHKLIGIAAELVDSLEDTVRGKMVTPEYLQNICVRLFAPSNGELFDISKPGTASSILRASLAYDELPRLEESVDIPYKPSLDYDKIKTDVLTLPERKKAILLQALRWNLTQAITNEQRDSIVNTYVVHDILGCSVAGHVRNGILDILTSPSEMSRQYLARLFNALASLSAGRSYLAQNPSLVYALLTALKREPGKTSLTSENILGTLQKLSLRRQMQSIMIEEDLIQWLSQLLTDHDNLSDYSLEYSVALLMNLCLRSAGKRKCIDDAAHILRVLSDLLGHENQEIRPYVNGALYSILALPAVKEEARALGMEEILECFLKDDNPDMTRQIQFIIKQLNSDDPSATNAPESDDEDEEDDDDEGDAIDAELDKQEILLATEGELCGEELLIAHYSTNNRQSDELKSKKKISVGRDHPLTRPTTPGVRTLESCQERVSRPTTSTKEPSQPEQQVRPSTSSKSKRAPEPTSNAAEAAGADGKPPSAAKGTKVTGSGQVSRLHPSDVEKAFASRPKIPRTPDPRPRTGTPPPLGRSASPPRPASKESKPGTSSSIKSSGSKNQQKTGSR